MRSEASRYTFCWARHPPEKVSYLTLEPQGRRPCCVSFISAVPHGLWRGLCSCLMGGNLPWVHQSVISRAWAEETQCSVLNWQAAPLGGLGLAEVSACRDVDLTHDAGQGKLETGLRQKLLTKILALSVAENPLPSPVCIIRDLSTHEEAGGKGRSPGFRAHKVTLKLNYWVVLGKLLDPWKLFLIWIREKAKHTLQGCCENQVSYHI